MNFRGISVLSSKTYEEAMLELEERKALNSQNMDELMTYCPLVLAGVTKCFVKHDEEGNIKSCLLS